MKDFISKVVDGFAFGIGLVIAVAVLREVFGWRLFP